MKQQLVCSIPVVHTDERRSQSELLVARLVECLSTGLAKHAFDLDDTDNTALERRRLLLGMSKSANLAELT